MVMNIEGLIKGRYRLETILGEALQGRTYLAIDESTGDPVVVKELELIHAEDWKEVELFERGSRTLRSLDHPQIPTFYDVFFDEGRGRFYLIQEYLEGVDLKGLIASGRRFSEEELRAFLRSMLSILEYLQAKSPPVVHRDIKPSNIVVRPDGEYILIDFDVVQTIIPDEVGGSTVVGTTGYMAPEQLIGRAGMGSDIYALGVTAVHMATGVEPMELPLRRGRLEFEGRSDLSDELHRFLRQMIEPGVQDRFQGAGHALRALHNLGYDGEYSAGRWPRTLTSLIHRRWVEIGARGEELRIRFLSHRPLALIPLFAVPLLAVGGLLGYWSLTSPFVIGDLRCWRFGAPGVLMFLIAFIGLRFLSRRQVVETGIEQRLRVSEAGVELREAKRFMWWGGTRRVTKSWSIPGSDLRGVYLQVLAEEELPEGGPLWRRALQANEMDRAGIVFIDSAGHQYFVGQELLEHESDMRYSMRLEHIQEAFEAIKSYLSTQGR